ncbi:MAG: FG-GAP-like repeat-containing protein [Beutenbergiaceae bacterium]
MRASRVTAVLATAAIGLAGVSIAAAPPSAADSPRSLSVPLSATDGAETEGVVEDGETVEPDVEVVELDDAQVVSDQPSAAADEPSQTPAAAAPTANDGPDGVEATSATFSAQTPPLAVVGVSWERGTGPADLEISWRSESDAGWGDWEELHVEPSEEPDGDELAPDARDGATPLAVIDATAVEVRVGSATGPLPADVVVAVVDPGTPDPDLADPATGEPDAETGEPDAQTGEPDAETGEPDAETGEPDAQTGEPDAETGEPDSQGASEGGAEQAAPGAVSGFGGGAGSRGVPATTAAPVGLAPMSGTARPTIYTRAQWGADESQMTWTPQQGRVQGIDIHHTVNANNYTASQVPGIIRGIYLYHAQSWGRGWGDIGYNFLVDRFGRIWEGRAGGITAAPIGAHATGLNSYMSGISLIGNFEQTTVPAAMFTAVARLAAWKLSIHGVSSPYGTLSLPSGTFNRVVGHRDAKQTACPGRYMYNRMAEMRARIASYIGSAGSFGQDRDLNGDGSPEVLVTTGTRVQWLPTVERGRWSAARIGSGWSRSRTVGAADFDGDGLGDLILIDAYGRMWLYPGKAAGGVSAAQRSQIGNGWKSFSAVLGGVDWDRDGHVDLLARRTDGGLWLYRGNGRGGFLGWEKVGVGWTSMTQMVTVDAFVSGRPALLARDSRGAVWAYPADGRGGFTARVSVPGMGQVRLATGVRDATGDGTGDLMGVDSTGRLGLYPGAGNGTIATGSAVPFGQGWSKAILQPMVPTGSNDLAFVSIRSDGTLWRYDYQRTQGAYAGLTDTGVQTASAGDDVLPVGDWDGDGHTDLAVINGAGRLLLHRGSGNGRFASSGTQIGNGWGSFNAVLPAGNWLGDGRPALLGFDRGAGRVWLYPGDGSGGFDSRISIGTGITGMNMLISAGDWSGGGAPDLLVRGADTGRLFLYRGNWAAPVAGPQVVGYGWSSMANVVGMGDLNNDGHDDLLALTASGSLVSYPGESTGSFGKPTVVGSIPASADIS